MNPLRSKYIKKRCDSCQEFYLIPLLREGHAQRLIAYQSTCPFCNPNADMCKACFVPFRVRKHYALGMCKMDYNLYNRNLEHHEREPEA